MTAKRKIVGYTLGDRYPDVYAKADQQIPQVWGSLREAWMLGYLGIRPNRYVRTSACETFWKRGAAFRRAEGDAA